MAEKQQEFEVGYKKPPVSGQFKKGNSGNPGGQRRKLARDINEALAYTLARRVGDDGERMSSLEAVVEKLVKNALGGDMRSIKLVIDRVDMFRQWNENELVQHSKENEELELAQTDAAAPVPPDTAIQVAGKK